MTHDRLQAIRLEANRCRKQVSKPSRSPAPSPPPHGAELTSDRQLTRFARTGSSGYQVGTAESLLLVPTAQWGQGEEVPERRCPRVSQFEVATSCRLPPRRHGDALDEQPQPERHFEHSHRYPHEV